MKFNYGLERKKFEARWKRLRVEYKEAGMNEEAIEEMWEFDWKQLKRERLYCRSHQYLDSSIDDDNEGEGTYLINRFYENFVSLPCEIDLETAYSWLDQIDNKALYKTIKSLKKSDLELLDMFAYKGYSVAEIARMQGFARQTVAEKVDRIKRLLKKCVENPA